MLVVVAGFGKSKSTKFRGGSRRDFLEQFMKAVNLDRPVLVTASMSGSFALPFVLRPEAATCTQRVRGFVPIAPAGTSKFSANDYGGCLVRLRQGEHNFWPSLHVSFPPFVMLLSPHFVRFPGLEGQPEVDLEDLRICKRSAVTHDECRRGAHLPFLSHEPEGG